MRNENSLPATLSVIILTYDEERNLERALTSVVGWADHVFVLDSLSTDRTLDIARRYDCHIAQHRFENYAKQRNYALTHLPIATEWVLFLDADEWVPDALKQEITEIVAASPGENGFYIKFRFMWMGSWIRRGYYPTWILRLFRQGRARCEDRAVNEHMIVDGPAGYLMNDFIHEDRSGLTEWISKHNGYATREARELMCRQLDSGYREMEGRLIGSQSSRRRWLRQRVWNRLPPLLRPFIYFFYRYFLLGGFLDGKAAFSFHFLHALWYPLLIDLKYLEMTHQTERTSKAA